MWFVSAFMYGNFIIYESFPDVVLLEAVFQEWKCQNEKLRIESCRCWLDLNVLMDSFPPERWICNPRGGALVRESRSSQSA